MYKMKSKSETLGKTKKGEEIGSDVTGATVTDIHLFSGNLISARVTALAQLQQTMIYHLI